MHELKFNPTPLTQFFLARHLNFPINVFDRTKFSLTQDDEICPNPASKGAPQKIEACINFTVRLLKKGTDCRRWAVLCLIQFSEFLELFFRHTRAGVCCVPVEFSFPVLFRSLKM